MRAVRALLIAAYTMNGAAARADWSAGNPGVAAAAREPRIAAALAATVAIDAAAMADDHAAFAALLADDLAVNNPQNGVSVRGATAQRSQAGQISYRRYHRTIDYAGLRGDMVVLMGEEVVVTRGATAEMHRRFTDLWKPIDGRWLLTARQATIIQR